MNVAANSSIEFTPPAPTNEERRLAEFHEHARNLAASADEVDEFTAPLRRQIANILNDPSTNPPVANLLHTTVKTYDDIEPDVLYFQIQKEIEYIDMKDDPLHPRKTTEQQWDELLSSIADEGGVGDEYQENPKAIEFTIFVGHPIATNIGPRLRIIPPLLVAEDIMKPRIVDAACALELGLKQMNMQHHPAARYEDVEVRRFTKLGRQALASWLNRVEGSIEPATEPDDEMTMIINYFMHHPDYSVGESVGIDQIDPKVDGVMREHSLAQMQRMGERKRGIRSEQIKLLTDLTIQSPNISFVEGDITDVDPDLIGREQFDEYLFSTVLYQLANKPDKIADAFEIAHQCLKPGRPIRVIDFIKSFNSAGIPSFYPAGNWRKWAYGLWSEDTTRPDRPFRRDMYIDEGRVNKIVLAGHLRRKLRSKFYETTSGSPLQKAK